MRRFNLSALLTLAFWLSVFSAPQAAAGKIYWTDIDLGKIQRANLEIPLGETPSTRTDIENLLTGLLPSERPLAIKLDLVNNKMYWLALGLSISPPSSTIKRANLDGSNEEDLITGLAFPHDIALDVADGKMYWTDFSPSKIQRADLEIPLGETPSTRTDIEDLVIIAGIGVQPQPSGLATVQMWKTLLLRRLLTQRQLSWQSLWMWLRARCIGLKSMTACSDFRKSKERT
jgi:hypothetical protein